MVPAEKYAIPLEQLKRVCDCEQELSFCQTSMDVPPLEGVIGQDRAVRSMKFGLDMDAPGYNIFVVGPPGTGKNTYVSSVVTQIAAGGKVPDDWCYIHNFNDKDNPLAVALPPGQGRIFQQDMDELVKDLRSVIPKAFESSDYEQQKDQVVEDAQAKLQETFNALEIEARGAGFMLKQVPGRFLLVPAKEEKALTPEEFEQLPLEERHSFEERGQKLEKKLEDALHAGRVLEKDAKEKVVSLEKQIAMYAALPQIQRLKEKYAGFPKITEYLDNVLKDVEENHEIFKEATQPQNPQLAMLMPQRDAEDDFIRYKVNLFVNNERTIGAPVVVEPFLYYYNLFGKVEYRNQLMALTTSFLMARSGAIHRANGGYLILQAKDVLTEPFVWDTLKRAIKYRQAVVENIGEQYRYVPTATMRMEPIPLNVKVILIGSPMLYLYMTMDEDFSKLFKVKVDFDVEMQRNGDNLCKYTSFVSSMVQNEQLKPFSRQAMARIVEYGSRLAGDQNKLSTRFNDVGEVVYEADNLAKADKSGQVEAAHVDRAIRERKYRSNRIEEKIQEMIRKGKLLIDTHGAVVGQVNGLSVLGIGGYMFGQPSRITAVTYMGRGGVINIERETDMSGNIHSKGVLTMAGFLGSKFAQDAPLGLTAQITFEQNYGGVDGDSASCAELYAIISSLSGIPIRQSLAVTGSVNQLGYVQPIGGATEKIEGFFDVCAAKGLTGDQGVVIPVQNIDNLMLKEEILAAVRDGKFHLYAVRRIEEGIELLTGIPAGEPDANGRYPEGTVFRKVSDKVLSYYEKMANAARQSEDRLTTIRVPNPEPPAPVPIPPPPPIRDPDPKLPDSNP